MISQPSSLSPMPIGYDQIDPILHQALMDRYSQIFAPNAVLDPVAARVKAGGTAAWKRLARKHAANFWAAMASFAGAGASLAILGSTNAGLGALGFASFAGLAAGLTARGFRRIRMDATQEIPADLLRAAGTLISLTPAEKAYCDAVAALIDAERSLPTESRDDLLSQLNELLASARRLGDPARKAAAAGPSIKELESELAGLLERREARQDPRARATMDQTIGLCRQRLEAAQAMVPAREQAEAQQELIHHTFASVQSSLARLASAQAVSVEADVQELQSRISQTYYQAQAVEKAVEELKIAIG